MTVVAERSWAKRIAAWFEPLGSPGPCVAAAPPLAGVPGAGLIGSIRAARRRGSREPFGCVMFGNARLGLVPAMYYAQWMSLGSRYLLFAHRDPGSNFLDAVSTLRFDTVANSEWVASWYRGQTGGPVDVCYGLANAERFFPGPRQLARSNAPADDGDGLVHFCLLGRLPNISKGQEKALAAFRALPDALRRRCRLHLASFASPPDFQDPTIVAHPWMPAERIPDFLRQMDVLLTISSHETFSQAIVQGMLSALPIIATPLPVYIEKLDPVIERVAPSGAPGGPADAGPLQRMGGFIARSTAEVTAAMERLASDAAMRRTMGAQGRAIALDRYVWDTARFVDRYLFPARG